MAEGVNALTDPALACELTLRERTALMGPADWEDQVDRVLSWPVGVPTPLGIEQAASPVGGSSTEGEKDG